MLKLAPWAESHGIFGKTTTKKGYVFS